MDFDGDIIFSTNDSIISKGSYDYGIARPLYYELGATGIIGTINDDNATQADIRGLNSKVGQISNKAASFYAMLESYDMQSKEYKAIYDQIIVLGEIVGREIDKIKTGIKPITPMEWKPLQVEWKQNDNPDEEDIMITPLPEAKGIYRHNAFVPDVKPYFLRYNYQYLDKDIRHLRSVYNKTSKTNFWLTFEELKKVCENAEDIVYPIVKCTPSLRMCELYNDYLKIYPVNNSDCIVNHIAHLFEDLDFKLHKQISKEGRNMLVDMVSEKPTDKETFENIKNVFYLYKRFLKSETVERITNKKDGNKEIIKSFSDRLCAIRKHYYNVIIEICGTCQSAFDHLVYVAEDNEKYVWDLLGDDILKIVG